MHADDLADACYFLMQTYNDPLFINVGTGSDVTIKQLAELIKEVVDYPGELRWNTQKPDGTPRKLMDVSRLHGLGWQHRISLREGIERTYQEYVERVAETV